MVDTVLTPRHPDNATCQYCSECSGHLRQRKTRHQAGECRLFGDVIMYLKAMTRRGRADDHKAPGKEVCRFQAPVSHYGPWHHSKERRREAMAPGVLHRSVGLGIATHRHRYCHEARSDSLTTVSSILRIGDAGLKCWLAHPTGRWNWLSTPAAGKWDESQAKKGR